jgi:hypothetical protein
LSAGSLTTSGDLPPGKCLDQAVLEFEPVEVLLDSDPLVAAVRAHIVDVAERAVDAVGWNPGVSQVKTVGRTSAHLRTY